MPLPHAPQPPSPSCDPSLVLTGASVPSRNPLVLTLGKSYARSSIMMFTRFSPLILIITTSHALASPERTVSLQDALDLAHKNNLSLIASQSKLDKAHALEDQATAARYPKILGTGVAAPSYKVTGDPTHSENDLKSWGAWLQGSLTVLQPVYTWGKLDSLREAARKNIEVQSADIVSDLNQLDYEIKEVYYGSVLTEQLFNFLDDGRKDLEGIKKKILEDTQKKHPKIPRRDTFRFQVFTAEADYRWQEAAKFKELARHALSFKLGFDPNEETVPQDTTLLAIEQEQPSENELLEILRSHRPELTMLERGIQAKQALLEAERANKMPMFFVGGMLTFAYSNVRTPQNSAFAFDPYNRSSGGIGAGVQWNFDFKTTLANEGAIIAEITELERKQGYANQGIRMELKKSIADLKEARSRLDTSKSAYDIGRKWLISESMSYSLGLGEIKDLIDAYLARAKTAKDFWDATFRVNMAWASLTKTIGVEVTPGLMVPPSPQKKTN